jgi:hypothetical protein
MSYKLYTDKLNKFQCSIQVEGTSLSNSQARVILEGKDEISYLFKGKLYENGVCEFDLPKMKNILGEGDSGTIRLEIIADDVHFEPWSSEFSVVADKKVNVVVKEQIEDKKPKIVINTISLDKAEPKVVEQKPKVVESVVPKKQKGDVTLSKKQVEELLKRRNLI